MLRNYLKVKKAVKYILVLFGVLLISIALYYLNYYNILPKKVYYNADFDIVFLKSKMDFNKDGIDDYTDILFGAKKDANNKPKYDGSYTANGYPNDDVGVCTDVIWRAFKSAGYSLKDMLDQDINENPQDYRDIVKKDSNIDFRRVKNLKVFFDKYATSLTLDISEISEWQAGDIVVFKESKHIGIISDKRNRLGQPYVIHNSGQPRRDEDFLSKSQVISHYRFDASIINPNILIAWKD